MTLSDIDRLEHSPSKYLLTSFRDVDNSRKPGKSPGCEHDFFQL